MIHPEGIRGFKSFEGQAAEIPTLNKVQCCCTSNAVMLHQVVTWPWPHIAHRCREPHRDETVQPAALETSLRTNMTSSGTPEKAVCVTGRATAKHVPRCPPPNDYRLACLCQSLCGRPAATSEPAAPTTDHQAVEHAHVPASALGIESLTCRV